MGEFLSGRSEGRRSETIAAGIRGKKKMSAGHGMHASAAAAAGGSNFIADDDDGVSCASTPSADGPTSLRSPNALRALSLLPGLDAQPNADAQQNGDHGHTPLVSGDDSDSGGAASARALAGPMQRAVPNGSVHLVGQRSDAQANGDAQTNGGGADGRGQPLVVAALVVSADPQRAGGLAR